MNLRGSDIDYNPVFFAYVIITLDKIYFFVDQAKLPANAAAHFEENQVKIEFLKYDDIRDKLSNLVSMKQFMMISYSLQAYSEIPLTNNWSSYVVRERWEGWISR